MTQTWMVLRHVEHEHLGTLASVLASQGIGHQYIDVWRNDPVPSSVDGFSGLIIMGGPMGVYEADKFPFITDELALISRAATAGMPVIGICLGAQMVAAALGARVFPSGRKEIGWYAVRTVAPDVGPDDPFTATLPRNFMAFHWHGDTFDLPAGATRLFESDLFAQQGFRWGGNVLALQFHFEVDRAMIADWLADPGCRAEVAGVPGLSAGAILGDTERHGEPLEALSRNYFASVLRQLTAKVPA